MPVVIDDNTIRILVRDAAALRRRLMDRPMVEAVAFAREQVERDCYVALMTTPPERQT
jgi:hypothetical protein